MELKMAHNDVDRFTEYAQRKTKTWIYPRGHDEETQKDDDFSYRELDLNPTCLTLKDLIEKLHKIFDSDRVNVEEVHALMSSYKSNPAEWVKYAKFDRHRYTRNLVDAGNGKFNLMVLCWGEGHASSIHDHANSHCFMKMLAGSLGEIRYRWPEVVQSTDNNLLQPMEEISRKNLNVNDVCYINDSIGLHRVENLSYSDCAVSLHLYCPPFEACKVFDLRTGRSTVSKVTFWSMFGERKRTPKPKVSDKTMSETESEE